MELYQEQLEKTQEALKNCDNEVDRENLISLENDLKELISLESYEANPADKQNPEDDDLSLDEDSSSDPADAEDPEEDIKVSESSWFLALTGSASWVASLGSICAC